MADVSLEKAMEISRCKTCASYKRRVFRSTDSARANKAWAGWRDHLLEVHRFVNGLGVVDG